MRAAAAFSRKARDTLDGLVAQQQARRGRMTELVRRMRHETAARCDQVRRHVIPANEENFDRLGRLLSGRAEAGGSQP